MHTTAMPSGTRERSAGAGPEATRGSGYPRTIDNGAGERLTFVRRIEDASGDRLEVRSVVAPGAGPPMHVHHFAEEALTVERGRIAYQRPGGQPQYAERGATVVFKPGEAHRFWNPGEEDLRLTGYITPVDNVEYFLTAMYASQRDGKHDRPDPFEAAFLARRYRSEVGVAEVPALVQRLVFPLLVLVGHALGRYRKYAGAPEPVKR